MSSEEPNTSNTASTTVSSSSSTNVVEHQQPEQNFTCNECGHVCGTQFALEKHVTIVHTYQLKCDLCDFGAHLQFEIDKHMKRVHKIDPPSSQQRGNNDFNDAGLNSGASTSQEQSISSKCPQDIAEHTFVRLSDESSEDFASFLQTVQPKTLICPICRATTTRTDSLPRHIKGKHPGENSYVCLLCYQRFLTYDELKKHKMTITKN